VTRRCKACQHDTPEELLAVWVNEGVKAEGMKYFCEPRCVTCAPVTPGNRCPRDPYCKRYIASTAPNEVEK
jgi:hypothetical protein